MNIFDPTYYYHSFTMRLLNTETVELHEFFEKNIPIYAILSHRWELEEITFKDVMKRRNLEAAGWNKVKQCCTFVRGLGLNWVWIDTCCIDKRSSAELSEAIHSMYRWYADAHVCFVYLNDVHCRSEEVQSYRLLTDPVSTGLLNSSFGKGPGEAHTQPISFQTEAMFADSAWFTRGWTLQELLAPEILIFVDSSWRIFGSKNTMNLLASSVTGIVDVANVSLHNASIATKMSWAAKRECTRPEDLAYSLMGVFEVKMPLLYGEGGESAFARLQLEILEKSGDESIFAFQSTTTRVDILAPSPSHFAHSLDIRHFQPNIPRGPYTMTNKGLEISTVLLPGRISASTFDGGRIYFMPLNCAREGAMKPLVVPLKMMGRGVYVRFADWRWHDSLKWPEDAELDLQNDLEISTIHIANQDHARDLVLLESRRHDSRVEHSLRTAVDKYMLNQ